MYIYLVRERSDRLQDDTRCSFLPLLASISSTDIYTAPCAHAVSGAGAPTMESFVMCQVKRSHAAFDVTRTGVGARAGVSCRQIE